ncbi:MAG: HlyD family efflux transporter periplasmic adaptor subunit [Coleofasciculaceae cyanobacterium]
MISNSNTDFLPPIQDNEFLPPIGRWTTVGGLVIVIVVGLAIPLASVVKYKETVKAQASLRPAGELRVVQAATDGQVMDISVEENQVVKTGDVIATIDDSRLQTQKSQLVSNIQQGQLQLFQINAQISALDKQIEAETNRINRAVDSAYAELSRRRRDYQDRQITTIVEFEEAQANLRSAKAALKAANSKQERYQSIADKGAISKNQLEEAQLEASQQEQVVEATKARRKRAQAALNPSQAEVAIATQGIAQEKARGQATLAILNKEKEALIQQRIEVQKQLAHDRRELQQVEIDLGKTIIRATEDGIISQLNLRNPGQAVQPTEEIAQIAPTHSPLVVKALVNTTDIGKVKTGQKAQLRIHACPYPDYGTLKGTVSAISPDAITPQGNGVVAPAAAKASHRNLGAASAFYEVTIEPESLSLGQGSDLCQIQLGMEGRTDIISREETVLRFLLRKARLSTDL